MKSRRQLTVAAFLSVALLLGGLFLAGFFDPRPDPELEQKLAQAGENATEPMVATEADRLGITALGFFVSESGGTAKEHHFGRSKKGAVMQAASLSKAVAAAVILIVAEQQDVGLDQDIRSQVTSVDIAALEGADRPVTLRQLLSHTTGASQSGYPGYPRGDALPTAADVIASPPRFFESALVFDGENGKFRYSGGGYTIAQGWAEDVTGMPFDEIASQLLLQPLGMTHSTFAQPIDDPSKAPRTITGADAGFDPTQGIFASLNDSWHNYPEKAAAGLWTTPSDYALFVRALLSSAKGSEEGAQSVIPQDIAKAMLSPQVDTGRGSDTSPLHYGLGVMLELDGEGRVVTVSHSGANAGYRSHFAAKPSTGMVAVSMANMGNAAPLNRAIVMAMTKR